MCVAGALDNAPNATPKALPSYGSAEFMLLHYKIAECTRASSHDFGACPFSHPGEKTRRRCITQHNYEAVICPDLQAGGRCPRGDACTMTHSVWEFWLHPMKYRTIMCRDGASCSRKVCFFAHSSAQLRHPASIPQALAALQQQQQQSAATSAIASSSSSAASSPLSSAARLALHHPGIDSSGVASSTASTISASGSGQLPDCFSQLPSPDVCLYQQQQQGLMHTAAPYGSRNSPLVPPASLEMAPLSMQQLQHQLMQLQLPGCLAPASSSLGLQQPLAAPDYACGGDPAMLPMALQAAPTAGAMWPAAATFDNRAAKILVHPATAGLPTTPAGPGVPANTGGFVHQVQMLPHQQWQQQWQMPVHAALLAEQQQCGGGAPLQGGSWSLC